jgi:2-C-methyl-D-erythritol 2,4-cyclodiphosphate synthase
LNTKIGIGYDIHRLVRGRKLYLGGVDIPHPLGLAGHSDGDCLVHAIIDALLGAAGEGDIGQLFPDSGPAYKGIRSAVLLRRVMARLERRKLEVLNVDTVIVAEAPLLAPYAGKMKKALCPILHITPADMGIKAKTNEGLGLVGKGTAVACWAVALVGKKEAKRA